MIEIIPAINAETFAEVEHKLDMLEGVSEWAHIDVANGTFAENTLWNDPFELARLKTNLKLEIHLMIADLEDQVEDWLAPPVMRILFHLTAVQDPESVIRTVHDSDKQVGISISPNESIDDALQYKNDVDFYQILTVTPGIAWQKAQSGWEERITKLRDACDACTIEVDGGINVENARLAVKAGATRIVSASYIFNEGDVKKNIQKLTNATLE